MTKLIPELELSLIDGSFTDKMIDHPLLREIFYHDMFNERYNQMFEYKNRAKTEAYAERDWEAFIFIHERPYRLWAFQQVCADMTDKEFWTSLRHVWEDSENIWQNRGDWNRLFKSKRGDKECFMTPNEKEVFDQLPEIVEAYRGYEPGKNINGLSFTIDKDKAQWFANRFCRKGKVKVVRYPKECFFAFIDGRSEKELILKPR